MKKVNVYKLMSLIIISIILYNMIYFIDNIKPYKINIDGIGVKNNKISYFIDEFQYGYLNSIFIRGWAFEKDINNNRVKYTIICKNINTENVYAIKTFSEKRIDVTENINDGYNYNFCGFNGRIIKFMLPEKGEYQILILFEQNNKKYLIETPYSFYNKY